MYHNQIKLSITITFLVTVRMVVLGDICRFAEKNPRRRQSEPTKFRIIAKFFLFRKTQQKWQRFSTTYQEHLASFC